ncbi:putative cysteine-rich repeat secretory protein 7 [Andrographis paniculata]|uniref:putative cysteine-rich repeat secretory protein 7 n=1 Tax=Andrographis paniculata TaxID=175694 RepID=UPI0021E8A04B|nr:putative cysteine-rich repeat secretory protein 7 [Andrographis paniculata]
MDFQLSFSSNIFYLLFFSTFSLSKQALTLTPPPLLSLDCKQTNPNPKIQTLLANLTSSTPTTSDLLATSTSQPYTGLMQCRPGLGPPECTLCAETARAAISALCPNPSAVSAWFDGCYLKISDTTSSPPESAPATRHSCSDPPNNPDPGRFEPALETLLLILTADVNLPSRRGFSQGHIPYGSAGGEIYGVVECARSLSTGDCGRCVRSAAEKVQLHCGGRNGGREIVGACIVRYSTEEIYRGKLRTAAAGESVTGGNCGGAWKEGGDWRRKEAAAALAYWGGGAAACFAVVGLAVWVVGRTVLNRGKVGDLDFSEETVDGKIV